MMPESDLMALPEGMTCADCFHFKRCLALIGPDAINDKATRCDFSPRRFVAHHERLSAARQEIARLRLPPDETVSEHPGCAFCMSADTSVRPGQVCPDCGDRLPTKREYEADRMEKEIAELQEAGLRMLQVINRSKSRGGATVKEWDEARQGLDRALKRK